MNIKSITTAIKSRGFLNIARLIGDWQSFIRFHFFYSSIESGLIDALEWPSSREELIEKLNVKRTELLDVLLDMGLSLGELSLKKGKY